MLVFSPVTAWRVRISINAPWFFELRFEPRLSWFRAHCLTTDLSLYTHRTQCYIPGWAVILLRADRLTFTRLPPRMSQITL